MSKGTKPAAPKSPAKKVTIDPKKKKGEKELSDEELKGVAGGLRRSLTACTCSNMPKDPG